MVILVLFIVPSPELGISIGYSTEVDYQDGLDGICVKRRATLALKEPTPWSSMSLEC